MRPSAAWTAGAKRDLPDHGVCKHVLHRILDEDPTLMKHRDDPGDHADELHIVLDDDEAGADVDSPQQRDGALDLVGGHAGRGLIEQDQLRVLRHRHADLDPLPLAVSEGSDVPPCQRGEAELHQQLIGNSSGPTRTEASVGRDEKMLVDGKTVPYAWDLVLDADAEPRDPMRRLARDIAAFEQDRARRRRQLSAESGKRPARPGSQVSGGSRWYLKAGCSQHR